MDGTFRNKTPIQPRRIDELLPNIRAILTKEDIRTLSSTKQQHTTTVTNFKPMNLEELSRNLSALQGPKPRLTQSITSIKKRPWNSSAKVDKTKSLTANGQMKYNTVRKTLKFQSKPTANNRPTIAGSMAKKSLHVPVQTDAEFRISGVWKIPETPVFKKKASNLTKTPNISSKSYSDESFLQTEKEINEFEEKTNALTEEPTLERIAEISPPFLSPFQGYRNAHFDNSCDDEKSIMDNTLMCFDKTSSNEGNNNNENLITSLCEMLTKTAIINSDNINTELDGIIQLKKPTENNLKMLDSVISSLKTLKAKQLTLLQNIIKLENEKNEKYKSEEIIPLSIGSKSDACIVTKKKLCLDGSPVNMPSVSRPATYKVPKRRISLSKRILCKSMPDVSDKLKTPVKTDKAINMYMQIKQQMPFLNTPLSKRPYQQTPDTPAITSHNLQKQLNKLYSNKN